MNLILNLIIKPFVMVLLQNEQYQSVTKKTIYARVLQSRVATLIIITKTITYQPLAQKNKHCTMFNN